MTQKHLEYFLKVLRYQNISLAAKELYISRQALSKIIREMEQELGVNLFVRMKEGVRPTDDGLRIAQHAAVIMKEFQQMINPISQKKRDELTIFTFDDIIDYLSADFIIEYTKTYPNILLHFVEGTDISAHDNLLLHRCDVAIVPDSIDVKKFSNEFLFHSQYGVIINRENPLSKNEIVSLDDLAKEKVIGKSRELLYYQNDLEFIFNQGCDIDFIVEVSENSVARRLVENNIGVALAWNYAIHDYLDNEKLVFRPLITNNWGRNIYFIQNTDTICDKKINAFRDFLCKWISKRKLGVSHSLCKPSN